MRERAILLVEDNPDDEALAVRAFRKANVGNEIVVAHDGVEALDYLLSTGPDRGDAIPPRLVLLDLKLPRIDGLEVLRRMKQDSRTRLLPVVVLTSSAEQQDLIECYTLGANSYIRKPVDFAEFIRAVEQIRAYWLTLNEPPPEEDP